ncbi:MAG: ice-binding family protein [Acidimicrobiales bacterium]
MTSRRPEKSRARRTLAALLASEVVAAVVIAGTVLGAPSASAGTTVGLGTATSFAVLGGTTVTNTGPTVVSGNLGVDPGSAVTGFPPGTVTNGTQYAADAVALQAQNDLTTAYNAAAAAAPTDPTDYSHTDLGGLTLPAGVYNATTSMSLNGTLTLTGDASSVFIFQAGSTLSTGQTSPSSVVLTGGAQACHVFWQVGSSATLFTGTTTFVGSILALTSDAVQTGVDVNGRVLARNGAVTLDSNAISAPACATAMTTAPSRASMTVGSSVNDVATVTGNATDGTPTGSVQFYQCGPGSVLCSSASGTALTPTEPLVGGIATSPSFTPGAAGTYCFAAVYSPSPNSAYGTSSEAGSTTNGECVVVTAPGGGGPPPGAPAATITTTAPSRVLATLGTSVNDVATVTGNATDGTPTGSVQFYQCGPGSVLCSSASGAALAPAEPLVGGLATSASFTPTAVGTYCFAAVYTPSGSTYAGSSEAGSPANGECFVVAASVGVPPPATPAITITTTATSKVLTTLGSGVNDVATVTGNATDGTPTGSVQFYECGPGSILCSSASGTALPSAQPLSHGTATSASFTPTAVGTYCFAAVYTPSGSTYAGSSEAGSVTNGECFVVAAPGGTPPPATPAITITTTTPSATSATVGNGVADIATVTGNAANGSPTGSVQFFECGPGSILCSSSSGTPLPPIEALHGGVATSATFTPTTIGTYCFAVVYTPSGSTYAASSEAGTAANGECFAVTAATTPPTTTPPGKTPPGKTPPTTTPPSVPVPPQHTGAPWAAWSYWLLVALAGVTGLGLVVDAGRRRRRY